MDSLAATVASDPSLRDAADVAAELGVDPAVGLTSAEAARRLREDGPNELRAKPPVPLWRKILAQFQHQLIYLLLGAVAISLIVWAAEGAVGVPIDATVITAVVILNAALGLVQESRAETAVAALKSMTEASSTVLRDGELRTVPSHELVRGDILMLNEGDAVGADARLLSASALRVQEASLTGESEAVTKDPSTLPRRVPLGDRQDMVYKGTAVTQGVGRAVVTATGMATEMGAIAGLLEATEEDASPLQKEMAGVSRLLGITVV
ncbi:cation-transporting P-type ATPase, partial [Mycolicibacterium elephantis]